MRNRCVADWALKVFVSVSLSGLYRRLVETRCIASLHSLFGAASLLHYQGWPCCTDRGGVHTALLWISPLHYWGYTHCVTGDTPTALLGSPRDVVRA
jgi:hypothetical protein